MRYVKRHALNQRIQTDLDRRQEDVDATCCTPGFDAISIWSSARRSDALQYVLRKLRSMMGDRQRCMYCLDSHGTDIEHFWPKKPYPNRMFKWLNLLLCCAECGRFKGDRFPMGNDDSPLLIDPSAEDPWNHLDFDPDTGNIVPRFDFRANDFSDKGKETVDILKLDRREAMAAGYKRTLARIRDVVDKVLNQEDSPDTEAIVSQLHQNDEHGLLGWCFTGSGRNEYPFAVLLDKHPVVWDACVNSIKQ